jgi:hypothetical protein
MRRVSGGVAVAVLALVLSGCGWVQSGATAGQTNSNDLETTLSPANVGSLVDHLAPGLTGRPLVVGELLLVTTETGLSVFKAADCPKANNSACTPLWSRAGVTGAASDGTSIFVFAPGHGLTALDLHGAVLWDMPPGPDTESHTSFDPLSRVVISAGYVMYGQIRSLIPSGVRVETLFVAAATGCGQPHCTPIQTFTPGAGLGRDWAVDGHVIFLVNGSHIAAKDLATGAELWRSQDEDGFQSMTARDGSVYAWGSDPAGIQVYNQVAGAGCSGTPKVCAPLRTLVAPLVQYVAAVTRDRVVTFDPFHSVSYWFRTDDLGCTGIPLTCGFVAKTNAFTLEGRDSGQAAVANEVVYVSSGTHLFAYDLTTASGCTGASPICSPILTKTYPGGVSKPIIADGRVFFFSTDGLHALSLPA